MVCLSGKLTEQMWVVRRTSFNFTVANLDRKFAHYENILPIVIMGINRGSYTSGHFI